MHQTHFGVFIFTAIVFSCHVLSHLFRDICLMETDIGVFMLYLDSAQLNSAQPNSALLNPAQLISAQFIAF